MSFDEDLQFFMENKQIHQQFQSPKTTPSEYFQDSQLPDDSMNIDKSEKISTLKSTTIRISLTKNHKKITHIHTITTDVAINTSSSSR
ncbi:unnamed protein product [Brassica rapa subsp. narinosa]